MLSMTQAPLGSKRRLVFSLPALSYFCSARVFFPLRLTDSWSRFSARMPQGRRADPGGYTAAICRFNEMGRAAKKFKRRTGLGQHGKSGVQL